MFLEEEDLAFYVIIDSSASMAFGQPVSKFDYARRAAAALGYIALNNQDKVGISAFASGLEHVYRPSRGKFQLHKLVRFLREIQPGSTTSLTQSCREFVAQHKQSGIVVLISDFMDDFGYQDALKQFFLRPYDLYVIQVLAQEEKDPQIQGHLELVDSETGRKAGGHAFRGIAAAVSQNPRDLLRRDSGLVRGAGSQLPGGLDGCSH